MLRNRTKFDLKLKLDISSMLIRQMAFIFCVFGGVIAVAGLIILAFNYKNLAYSALIYSLIIAVVGFCLYLGRRLYIIYTYKKSLWKDDNSFTDYVFNEKNVVQEVTRQEEVVSITRIKYADITMCLEIKDYILLYFSDSNCFAVNKAGMIDGTDSELRTFLQNKVTKYKIK